MRSRLSDAKFLTALFLLGGIALRLWQYALNHVIWYDEAVLLANILGKNYGELLGPLGKAVAAPPFYLWMLKSVHLIFGDQPFVWRLLPLIAGVATLFATVPLARAVLTPQGAAFAVGLVAVSDAHIRLCVTVKPYTLDALVTTLLLYGLVRTGGWPLTRRLYALAAVAPFVLCTSYPSAFVVGGLLLALWPNDRRTAVAWAVAGAAVLGTFALLYFGPIRDQRVGGLVAEWRNYYPPLADPLAVPGWLAWNVSGVFQFMANPSSMVLVFVAPAGWYAFWRTGHRRLAVALAGLFAAVLAAAVVKSYPFGQNRLMQFAAPAVGLLGARGLEVLAGWRRWAGVGLGVAIICVADGLSLWRAVHPWQEPDARAATAVVREHRQPGEPVLSDEGNYLYYFHGELRPIADGATVPVGGRAWVVMDHYDPPRRHEYIDRQLVPLGFERVRAEECFRAGAYLYQRTR